MESTPLTSEKIRQAADDLELANDEEQNAFDNLPDNLVFSMRADVLTDNLNNLADALVDIEMVAEAYEKGGNPYQNVKKEIASVIKNCTEAIER